MAMLPMAMYGLEVPAGDVAISARPDFPASFRITMAAIDPTAEPEGDEGAPMRATLKVIRQPLDLLGEDDDEDDDDEEFDAEQMERILAEADSDEDSEDDEEKYGGPSDPEKAKKVKLDAAWKAGKLLDVDIDMEDEDENSDGPIPNGINGTAKSAKAKGKMPAGEGDELDTDSDDEDEGEIEEFVICTLDPSRNYQQPLDITIGEDERVWFKVSGTHSIYLTGNYVEPVGERAVTYGGDDDDEYDMEEDSDEIDEDEDSEDELDDLEDPRIVEVDEDDEVPPMLIKAKTEKTIKTSKKNKRPAPESDDEDEAEGEMETLDKLISKSIKLPESDLNGEQKLSKKQLKKLKKNDGVAGTPPVSEKAAEKNDVETSSSNKSDKKVSFAKELEQGPTPTKNASQGSQASLGVKTVQGVTLDDKKLGTGQTAKSGDRVSLRYIGKLSKDNKVFDSNKKGKPFSFKLGAGSVIKGWDIGVVGMSAGGERRITIPAHLAYGSKGVPGIPPNSTLVFDLKLLDINKGK